MSEYVKKLRPRVTLGPTKRLSSSSELKRVIKKSKIKAETLKKNKKNKIKKSQLISEHPTLLSIPSSEIPVAPIVEVPKSFCQTEGEPNEKKGKRQKRSKTKSEVHEFLRRAGVTDVESVCLCLKAGIKNCSINIDGPHPLEIVILKSSCYMCETDVTVTVRDVLYQGATGGNYWGGRDTDIICPNKDCEEHFVVSEMCTARPELSDGKFYNHCDMCPGFGECIGDYRNSHCPSCGEHYFAGSMGQFKCTTCYSSSSDMEDGGLGDMIHLPRSSGGDSLIFSYLYKELNATRFDLLQVTSQTDLGEGDHYVIEEADDSLCSNEEEKEDMTCS